jgi:hypothetical protein
MNFSKITLVMGLLLLSCSIDSETQQLDQEATLKNQKIENFAIVEEIRKNYIDTINQKINSNLFPNQNNNKFLFNQNPIGLFVNETREIIIKYTNKPINNFAGRITTHYSSFLNQLIVLGAGSYKFGFESTDSYANNGLNKIRLPETIYWDNRKDNTYHSYTLITYMGQETNTKTLNRLKNILLNFYSYPGYKLSKNTNVITGGSKLVFGGVDVNNPETYVLPVGIIEQHSVPNGLVNITTTFHTFYKGTIRKTAFSYKNHLFVATHGEGINRFNNLPNSPLVLFFV